MNKMTFKQFLSETPISDYKTFGNFNKSSSFRHETDRKMVTSEKAIKNVRKKFGKTSYNFNLYFVNSLKANRHTELGEVSFDWVQKNLDPEVSETLEKNQHIVEDSINIIYTNNKGVEGVPLTPWIMAHRFAHAVRRKNGMGDSRGVFAQAEKHFISQVSILMEYYNKKEFDPDGRQRFDRRRERNDQLAMIYLFNKLATFKSARDKNLRDWFEIFNELIAQYIITGTIKFNPPPDHFEGGSRASKQYYRLNPDEAEEARGHTNSMANGLQYYIDDILSSAVSNIYVM